MAQPPCLRNRTRRTAPTFALEAVAMPGIIRTARLGSREPNADPTLGPPRRSAAVWGVPCGAQMPIPGFSLVKSPEFISAAEAVGMVIDRFNSSACTEAETAAWLSEQVRHGKLRLLWTDGDPAYITGLNLTGEGFIFIPGFPGARALDEFNWSAGELRRRVRYPKPVDREAGETDPSKLTHDELLARYGYGATNYSDEREPKEWVTEALKYRFTVKRASLVAILDTVPVPLGTVRVPLLDAAGVIANRLNVSDQDALDTIVEAAATKRIKVFGTPEYKWQGDRIRPRVWRGIARGEATLTTDPSAGASSRGSWSDPYVFRADLEELVRELAGDSAAGQPETGTTEPPASATSAQSQSDKARLRRRVKEMLESEANIVPPRAQTKADWRRLVREECGDAVTDNLFDEVWREAALPAAWRAPGRRT